MEFYFLGTSFSSPISPLCFQDKCLSPCRGLFFLSLKNTLAPGLSVSDSAFVNFIILSGMRYYYRRFALRSHAGGSWREYPRQLPLPPFLACSQQDVPGQHNVSLGSEGGTKDLLPLTRGDVPRVILDFMSLGTVKPLSKSVIDLGQIDHSRQTCHTRNHEMVIYQPFTNIDM